MYRTRSPRPGGGASLLLTLLILAGAAAVPPQLEAQSPRVEQANWTLSQKFQGSSLQPYIYSTSVNPQFINETDEFWYRWQDATGTHYWRINPRRATKTPLFDHRHMAEILTSMLGKPFDRETLDLGNLSFTDDGNAIRFTVERKRLEFNLDSGTLKEVEAPAPQPRPERAWRAFSPDSTAYVYAERHNLYFVEMEDEDTVIQLTDDGARFYSFGSRGTGGGDDDDQEQGGRQESEEDTAARVRPNVNWSADSRRFFITRSDSRDVSELFLVNSLSEPRPTLETYRYAMPGEENVSQQELWVFDRSARELTELDVFRWKDQRLFDIHWPSDAISDRLRLVRRDRPQRALELIEVDLVAGTTRVILTENTENAHLRRQNVRYVKDGGDFIWSSRRTGWSHYYRYSFEGELRNQVTTGSWNAETIVAVDSVGNRLWVRGVGREEGENPYYTHLYSMNLDGSRFTLLDPGDADHSSRLSPSRQYVVASGSRTDMEPHATLRNDKGELILELEKMDLSRLEEVGWKMPSTFSVKAADGVTDLYGNMWLPFDFDPEQSYPIIAHVYPGPQTESVRTTFSATNEQQQLAQLGFVVIQIGNRGGSPRRSAAYHSYGYFNLRDYGLADKKTGIEQLANRHPWIDVNRVGIYGHSGGGFMTAAALLQPPFNEFFKVGVSSAGNHDNNVYNQNWSEQHHGLTVNRPTVSNGNGNGGDFDEREVTFEIAVPTNHELAENLVGRLLLVHGDMDNNVHPAGTIRLVDALIRADKRFDFMLIPGKRHGFGDAQGYFRRMMFEYFAEHLIGDYYRDSASMR